MKPRFDYFHGTLARGLQPLLQLEQYVNQSGLEASLVTLVKTRCSQMNGCAFCLDMHTKEARAAHETEQRLYTLSAWRETPFYSGRERAALEWAEALTLISEHRVTDALYQGVRQHFSEQELVDLSLSVVAINGWNRLAIAAGSIPGDVP